MIAWTPEQLDALEQPVKRQRIGKAVKGGPSERQIQRQIVKAVRALGIMAFHIPNEGDLAGGYKQWAVMRADGCMGGVPDLGLVNRAAAFGMLEIKKPGGALSDAQVAVIAGLRARGVPVAVVTSLDEAIDALKGWQWL